MAERRTLEPLDPNTGIYVVLWRTDKRENFRIFNNLEAEKDAFAYAGERAMKLNREIIVLGPHCGIVTPPENVKPVPTVTYPNFVD